MRERPSLEEQLTSLILLPFGSVEISFYKEEQTKITSLSTITFISPQNERISLDIFLGKNTLVKILPIKHSDFATRHSMVHLDLLSSECEIQLGSLTTFQDIGILLHEVGHLIQLEDTVFLALTDVKGELNKLDIQHGTIDAYFAAIQKLITFYPWLSPEIERLKIFTENTLYKDKDRYFEEREILTLLRDEDAFDRREQPLLDEREDIRYNLEEADLYPDAALDPIVRDNLLLRLHDIDQSLASLTNEESSLRERRRALEPALQRRDTILGDRHSDPRISRDHLQSLTILQIRWMLTAFGERDATYRALHIMRLLRDHYNIEIDDDSGSVERYLTKTALSSYRSTTTDLIDCVSIEPIDPLFIPQI